MKQLKGLFSLQQLLVSAAVEKEAAVMVRVPMVASQ